MMNLPWFNPSAKTSFFVIVFVVGLFLPLLVNAFYSWAEIGLAGSVVAGGVIGGAASIVIIIVSRRWKK